MIPHKIKKSEENYNLKAEYLIANRIVAQENCENADAVLFEAPRQAILFGKTKSLRIKKGGYILLDFGAELQGGVSITVPALLPGTQMRIVFGESVSEAMSNIGYKNATNDHSVRDTVIQLTSYQTFRYGNTGFRFVKLEAVNNDITVSCVQAVFEYRDVEYKGSFECSDDLLNEIWRVGAYTVHLNMQEYLWDGIKRDRLVWVGDMHPEVSTILSVFGDNEVIRKSLDVICHHTPSDKWMNGIPSYNLWWLKIQLDYYMWTGDYQYLKNHDKYIYDVCEHLLSEVNSDGTHSIENKFIEWNACNTEYEDAGFQALMVIGMSAASRLCRILGNDRISEQCKKTSELMKKHLYAYKGNKQVAAMVSLAEIDDCRSISDSVLKPGKAEGLSTFWGYYTLQALAKSDDMNSALEIICNFWGKMLKMGATTFWEDFDVSWAENSARIDEIVPEGKKDVHGDFGKFCYEKFRHSLCHGWASGPTAFLSQYVLGINIEEPGCRKIIIKPDLGNLRWAKGMYPTPFGNIYVEHIVENGKVITSVSAPEEIEIETVISS